MRLHSSLCHGAGWNTYRLGNEFKYDNDDQKPKPRGGGSAAGGVVVNQYIYANTTDYAKQQKEAARQFRMIARTV